MTWTIDFQLVKKTIQNKSKDLSCNQLHGSISCNKLSAICFLNTVKASYRTYSFVYMISVLMRIKQIYKNFKQQIPRILFNLIKSICFTALDMMIMRKILCIYNRYLGFNSKSLIYANIIGGVALGVQSHGRQIQIALYALNKSLETFYNSYKRRYRKTPIIYGQVILFAISISVVCYHYMNNKDCMRKTYVKIFDLLLKDL